MKKTFLIIFSLGVTSAFYHGCTPVDNSKAMMKADSTANARLMMLGDSMNLVCMTDVMTAARLRADSMMMMTGKSGKSTYKKPAPAPPANPKADKMNNAQQQATEEKKDKMENSQQSATDKKKAKMQGADTTKPK